MNEQDLNERIRQALDFLSPSMQDRADVALILGTGLSDITEGAEMIGSFAYSDIPGFPVSTVPGHAGRLSLMQMDGKNVLIMQGRFHYYEGYEAGVLSIPIRVLKGLGVQVLLLTNAAGSVQEHILPGHIVGIHDHINFQFANPLRGPNADEYGPRFPDMSRAYDPEILDLAEGYCQEAGIAFQRGTYLAVQGPNLETPAEFRMFHQLGADVIGMSTIPEVLAAVHSGMRVGAFSLVSNQGYPNPERKETSLEDVLKMSRENGPKLARLLRYVIRSL